MDSTRRSHAAPARGARRSRIRVRSGLILAAAGLAACSQLSENSDGIATLDVRLPQNLYLELGRPLDLSAVARDRSGDSVAAVLAWRTPDTTLAVDSATGIVTAQYPSGQGRVQVAVIGSTAFAIGLDNLSFILTAPADSLDFAGPDSLEAPKDSVGVSLTGLTLLGGSPLAPVANRPVVFRIVDTVPVDSPTVVLGNSLSNRSRDSTVTTSAGLAGSMAVLAARGKLAPDRVVVQVDAFHPAGDPIPGSGRRFVIRFRHQ